MEARRKVAQEARPGTPRVARDHEGRGDAEDPYRGAAQRDDELGSEVGVRVTADAVGTEAEHDAAGRRGFPLL